MKLIYKKALSKSGKSYNCISVDLGYDIVPLTFDSGICAQVLDCTPKQLASRSIGEIVLVEFEVKGGK